MKKITKKALPATISPDMFAHPEVRVVVMIMMENIKLLKKQINELQLAIEDLRR